MLFFARSTKHTARQLGFTLIEILVVATIIIVLSTIGMASYQQAGVRARNGKRRADMETVRQPSLSQMEFLLRNALELEANSLGYRCADNMEEIVLRSVDGKLTKLFKET